MRFGYWLVMTFRVVLVYLVSASVSGQELEPRVAALEDKVKLLEEKTAAMSVETIGDRPSVVFNGVNLHVRNGTGSTKCVDNGCDGLGNLIIGYNEPRPHAHPISTGSHNLIVGSQNNYSSYGGMVVGYKNSILGEYASVSGGNDNEAKGRYASISGGQENMALGIAASVCGGNENSASGTTATVCGGKDNVATGSESSVGGGHDNVASGSYASVAGGSDNAARNTSEFLPTGPGPQGTPGLSNVRYVCGNYVRIPGRTERQVDAGCPATQTAVGGGFRWQGNPATINVFMSSRVTATRWRVMAYSLAEQGNDPVDQDMVQACVVCANANP